MIKHQIPHAAACRFWVVTHECSVAATASIAAFGFDTAEAVALFLVGRTAGKYTVYRDGVVVEIGGTVREITRGLTRV